MPTTAKTTKRTGQPKIDLSPIRQVIAMYKGETGLNAVNARISIAPGHYYGSLVIDANTQLPKTEVIPLEGNNVLIFVHMDIRDVDGENEYKGVRCSFDSSFEKTLLTPAQWAMEFNLSCIDAVSRAGRKYSAVTIEQKAEAEV